MVKRKVSKNQINLLCYLYRNTVRKQVIDRVVFKPRSYVVPHVLSKLPIKPYIRSRKGEKSLNPPCFCGSCNTVIKTNLEGEIWCEGKGIECLKIDRPKTSDIKQAITHAMDKYYGRF